MSGCDRELGRGPNHVSSWPGELTDIRGLAGVGGLRSICGLAE